MAGPADLFDAAREYLDACIAAVTGSTGGPIDRTYVAPGQPAFDCCPQLTVHVGGPAIGDTAPLSPPLQPGHRIVVTGEVPLVTLTATVIRCVPTIDEEGPNIQLPDPALIEESAKETSGDLWAIWNHVAGLKRADSLFPPKTRELWFDPAVSVPTSGGCGGWQIPIRVALFGYREGP